MKNDSAKIITRASSIFYKSIDLFIFMSMLLVLPIQGRNLQDTKVSVKVSDVPLHEVLKNIEQQTNYTFSYFNEELPMEARVTMEETNVSLQRILEILSDRCNLTFTLINNVITVKQKQRPIEDDDPGGFGIIRGNVRDSVTSEIVPYANVYIPEIKRGTSTDARGFFIVPSVPAGVHYTVIISFVGYVAKHVPVFVEEDKIADLKVFLTESAIEVSGVVVTGERINETAVTVQKIPIKEFENMTNSVETDIMRSIQLQPGVQSAGDISAKYYVRGGASNENLVLLNETPIYNPFHALGIFSVIDPDMVNSVEFYKGGFGAKHDGRLSSVMDIITKDGNRNSYGATAAISQLTMKSAVEGPIPDGSFILTGRKSYSNDILKKFTNNKNVPIDFYDASFKVNYSNPDFLPISKFTFFGFLSNDNIDYKNVLHARYNWSNSNVGFNWYTVTPNSPYFSELTFYNTKFAGSEIPIVDNARHIENKLEENTFKMDVNYVPTDKVEYDVGIKLQHIQTTLTLSDQTGNLKTDGSEETECTMYGECKLMNFGTLKTDFGTRINIVRIPERPFLFFEPRVNLMYSISPVLHLKAAWGIYQQELVTISDEEEVLALFEPWIITPEYLKISQSVHYIGGLEYYITEKLKMSAEGYYKLMHHLAVVNDEKIYATDRSLIEGSGESHGAEVTLNYKTGRIYSQLSYAYSWTIKKVRDIEFHPRYDCRNAVKCIITGDLGNNWMASLSWNCNSGMPFTQLLGYYNKYDPKDVLNPVSSFSDYFNYPKLADRNAARMPSYHRLDMSISKKFQLWITKIMIDLNIINVYGRQNMFYFDVKTGMRVNMLPFMPTVDIKAEL